MEEVSKLKCSNCGTENSSNSNFCIHCGSQLKPNASIQKVGSSSANYENEKASKDGGKKALLSVLAVISVVIAFFYTPLAIVVFLAAIVSLFFDNVRQYGISVFITFGVLAVTGLVFMILAFGMCFAAFR